jgi:AraC-like DNA-binding protein
MTFCVIFRLSLIYSSVLLIAFMVGIRPMFAQQTKSDIKVALSNLDQALQDDERVQPEIVDRSDVEIAKIREQIQVVEYQSELEKLVEFIQEDQEKQILFSIQRELASRNGIIEDSEWLDYYYSVIYDLDRRGFPVKAYELLLYIDPSINNDDYAFQHYSLRAHIFESIGQYSQAVDGYQKALDVAYEQNNQGRVFSTLMSISTVFVVIKDFDSSLRYSEYGLEMIEQGHQLELQELAQFYANIGVTYRNQKKLEKAEESYLKSLAIGIQQNFIQIIAQNYANLGNLYKDQEKYEQAFEYYSKSLEISEQNDILFGKIANHVNMGSAYRLMGQFDRAIEVLNIAENLMQGSSLLSSRRSLYMEFVRVGEEKPDSKLRDAYQEKYEVVNNEINSLEAQNELLRKQSVLDIQLLERKISDERNQFLLLLEKNRQVVFVLLVLILVILIGFLLFVRRQRYLFEFYLKHVELAKITGGPVVVENGKSIRVFFKAILSGKESSMVRYTHQSVEEESVVVSQLAGVQSEIESTSSSEEYELDDALYARIVDLFKKEKVYIEFDLSLDSLALRLGTNKKYVSMSINQHSGMNFNEFVNAYRVQHGVKLLLNDKGRSIPLKQLQDECGFRSEPTFYRAFKQVTGLTPNQILRQSRQRISA